MSKHEAAFWCSKISNILVPVVKEMIERGADKEKGINVLNAFNELYGSLSEYHATHEPLDLELEVSN